MKKYLFCLALFIFGIFGACATIYGAEISRYNASYYENRKAVIKNDNSLWMWGYSDVSLLGNGLTNGSDMTVEPVKVMDDVMMVSNGKNYTMALKTDGSLWGWGYNIYGQIGDGTGGMFDDERTTMVNVLNEVAFVSAGEYNTFAIKKDGSLWGWGRNEEGQLGDGTKNPSYSPIKIMDDVIFVTQGMRTVYAVKKDNTLWEIGKNVVKPDDSQVGLNLITPRKIMDNVIKVSTGSSSYSELLVLKTDSTLWTISVTSVIKPRQILSDVKDMSCGTSKSFAIKNDGSLWSWWHMSTTEKSDMIPKKIMDNVSAILVCFSQMSYLITNEGVLWEESYDIDENGVPKMEKIMGNVRIGGMHIATKTDILIPSPTKDQIAKIGKVYLNGEELKIADEMGYFFVDSNGRTQAPVRAFVEALGYNVYYDDVSKKITIPIDEQKDLVIILGEMELILGDDIIKMDTAAGIADGRTYVPIRFVAEALGCTIDVSDINSVSGMTLRLSITGSPLQGVV